jgi:hypothetical protein
LGQGLALGSARSPLRLEDELPGALRWMRWMRWMQLLPTLGWRHSALQPGPGLGSAGRCWAARNQVRAMSRMADGWSAAAYWRQSAVAPWLCFGRWSMALRPEAQLPLGQWAGSRTAAVAQAYR